MYSFVYSTGNTSVFWLMLVIINGLLAFVPANMARQKGYRFGAYWCLSFLITFLIGMIVVALIPEKKPREDQARQSAGTQ